MSGHVGRVTAGAVAFVFLVVGAGTASARADAGRVAPSTVSASPAAARSSAAAAQAHVRPIDTVRITVDTAPRRALRKVPTPTPAPTTGAGVETPASAAAAVPLGPDRVQTGAIATSDHTTGGVTWVDPAAVLDVEVRTLTDGTWSDWRELGDEAVAPDFASPEGGRALRGGTEAFWIGDADAVELSFPASATVPGDIQLALLGDVQTDGVATGAAATADPSRAVSGATSTSFASGRTVTVAAVLEAAPSSAVLSEQSAASAPAVISRSQWGAAAPVCQPDVASTLMFAVVHHTAGSNAYSTLAEAEAQIRNDQRYHQQTRGWCDIGYNFLVDKWGNVYEGRANSGSQPVIGVHAGGFNTASVGISMLGDYSSLTPSAAAQESVARLIAWRLSSYHHDPTGSIAYTTLGGENSRYAAGTSLRLPSVIGHRDVAYTACPGGNGYAVLGAIRARAHDLIGSQLVNPYLLSTSPRYGAGTSVAADVTGTIAWTLTVVDRRTGVELVRRTGTAGPTSGTTIADWDGRSNAGVPLGAGPYTLTVSGTDALDGSALVPWSQDLDISGSQNPPEVAPVALTGGLRYVAVTPARLVDTRATGGSLGPASRMDLQVTGVAGIPADAKAVALNVTAVNAAGVTYVSAWPAGRPRPNSSVLNTQGGRTTAAAAVVGVGGQGRVSLYNDARSTHLVVDVTGYFTDLGSATDGYASLPSAARLLDTRTSGGAIAGGGRRTVTVAGTSGIPAGATAVVVNVVARSAGAGYVAVVPSGAAPGQTSTVNNLPGRDVANRAVIPLNGGAIDVSVAGTASDVVVDVVGWFGPGGGQRFTPVEPVRAFDTRVGGRQLGEGEARLFNLAGVTGLPTDATSVLLNLTATRATAYATYLTAWGTGARPPTSDLNAGAGADIANLTLATPAPGGVSVYNNAGSVDVVGDVMGYFR